MNLAIGVDLGGTFVKAGLVTGTGRLVGRVVNRPVTRTATGEELARAVASVAAAARRGRRAEAIGVAIPASVTAPQGRVVRGTSNLKGLEEYPFRARVARLTGLPCAVGNDANLAALGESVAGAARGRKNVLLLTLGTGIGSGLVLNGTLWEGTRGYGAEYGISAIRPPRAAGLGERWMLLEELVSAESMRTWAGGPSKDVFARAKHGDRRAQRAVGIVYEYLGMAAGNANLLLDLEMVVLGGGMAKAGASLARGVTAAFRRLCPEPYQGRMVIRVARLGDAAGVVGAARFALDRVRSVR
jgi:glucokinase